MHIVIFVCTYIFLIVPCLILDTLTRIVLNLHSHCSLEMPLTLMARFAETYYSIKFPIDLTVLLFYILNSEWFLILSGIIQYAIFGKVTKGDETLRKLEQLPTRKEGIFVMV